MKTDEKEILETKSEQEDGAVYELPWEFNKRLTTEHLGAQKYTTSTKALRELVANSLDAQATVTFRVIDGGLFQIVDGEMAKFSCVPWIGWGWLRVRV